MKGKCRNCHFLAKSYRADSGDPYVFSWSEDERSSGFIKSNYSPNCNQGVWDAGIDPSINAKLNEYLDKPRKDTCFFIRNQPGMSFPAAMILQERAVQNSQLKRSHMYTQIGLYIAALALFINVLVSLFK